MTLKFEVTEEEYNEYAKWVNEHNKTCKYYDDGTEVAPAIGAIGGQITWSFTETSLGVVTEVSCACGEKCNVTNYDNW